MANLTSSKKLSPKRVPNMMLGPKARYRSEVDSVSGLLNLEPILKLKEVVHGKNDSGVNEGAGLYYDICEREKKLCCCV